MCDLASLFSIMKFMNIKSYSLWKKKTRQENTRGTQARFYFIAVETISKKHLMKHSGVKNIFIFFSRNNQLCSFYSTVESKCLQFFCRK